MPFPVKIAWRRYVPFDRKKNPKGNVVSAYLFLFFFGSVKIAVAVTRDGQSFGWQQKGKIFQLIC